MYNSTSTQNGLKRVGQGIASLSLAFYLSGCATNLHVPEEAVTTSSYAASLMQSDHLADQVQGHLVFMHYVVHHGGEEFGLYFEGSPELALIWNDYARLSSAEKDEVRDIMEEVDFNRPATRIKAVGELAKVLPSFKSLESDLDTMDDSKAPERHYPEKVSVYREGNGKLVFDLTPDPAG